MLAGRKGLLLGLSAFVAVTAAGIAGYDSWDYRQFARRSPIAAGLPLDAEDADGLFRDRVQARFPDGTSAAELMRELSAQGFVDTNMFVRGIPSRAMEPVGSLNGAFILVRNASWLFGCWQRWDVSWTMTVKGRISVLNTQYQHVCA